MRIGVNALYLIPGRVGGTEIYLRNLLAGLAEVDPENDYTVFTNRETDPELVPGQPNFHLRPTGIPASIRPVRILYEQFALPLRAGRFDVMLNPGFTASAFSPWPSVTVFHDLQHKRHPENFRPLDLPAWQFLLWLTARRSQRLIAVSDATRADLLAFYHLPPGKVAVVTHGVEPRFHEIARLRAGSTLSPYLLCVSTLHPHKGLDRLVRVFTGFRQRHPDFRLVIVGMRGFSSRQLERTIDEVRARAFVELTGWIPRHELYSLFEQATAFVYPSTFEGFGMPVLEALAAGLPTTCSSIAALREVAGDSAVFFDPHSDSEMAAALDRIVEDSELRCRLVCSGKQRAAAFSWTQTAERTLEVLREAALA